MVGEEWAGGAGAHLAAPGKQLTDPDWLMVSLVVAGNAGQTSGLSPGPSART